MPPKAEDTLVYQNIFVGQGRSVDVGGGTFESVLAQTDVQRGGQIVGEGLNYFVSLQRLVLSTPLPTLIAELGGEPNGVDLAYTLELVGTISGGPVNAQATFRLLKAPADQVPYTRQPSDEYAFIANVADYVALWNSVLGQAWDGAISAPGSTYVAADRPIHAEGRWGRTACAWSSPPTTSSSPLPAPRPARTTSTCSST